VALDGPPGRWPPRDAVVAVLVDETLYVMTTPDEQKARNLARNPRVAITTGTNTWDRGLDLVVKGTARRVTDEATLRSAAEAWGSRWDGRRTLAVGRGGPRNLADGEPMPFEVLVFAIDPTAAYGHAKGRFGHTNLTLDR